MNFDIARFRETEPAEKLTGPAWYFERQKRRASILAACHEHIPSGEACVTCGEVAA